MTLPWTEPLLERLRRADMSHALLIHGPRGVGKLQLAERAAQAVLCEAEDPRARPCGRCEGCRWLESGNHPDFRRVEPEALAPERPEQEADEEGDSPAREAPAGGGKKGKPSIEIKVEQVRELAGFLNVGSHRGRRRVALVHPAEDMNLNAANALLKSLEEPPGGAMFILVSHRPARLLPTIRSRCVGLPVPLPAKEEARAWMAAQGVRDADRWLAFAGGAPLRAMEYAGHAQGLDALMSALAEGRDVPVNDREAMEVLVEVLQKMALDQALVAAGQPARYGTEALGRKLEGAPGMDWVAYLRRLGADRRLARHPLNPALFAADLLARMPTNK